MSLEFSDTKMSHADDTMDTRFDLIVVDHSPFMACIQTLEEVDNSIFNYGVEGSGASRIAGPLPFSAIVKCVQAWGRPSASSQYCLSVFTAAKAKPNFRNACSEKWNRREYCNLKSQKCHQKVLHDDGFVHSLEHTSSNQ